MPSSISAAVGLTVLSGLLHGAAFPPHGYAPVAWIALVPWLLALSGRSAAAAAGLGALWGIVAAWSVGEWMPAAIVRYFGQPWPIGILAFAACALVTVAPYSATFALAFHRLTRHPAPATPLLVAAAWVSTEFARATLPLGNPWSLLGYSQVGSAAVLHAASWGGIFAVGGTVALANAALAAVYLGGRASLAKAAPSAILLVGVIGCGAWATAAVAPHPPTGPATPVAVVQANLDLGAQWRPELFGENLGQHLDLTADATAGMTAPLVVWPESALTFFLEHETAYRGLIAATLRATDAQLLTGGPRAAPGPTRETPRYRNAAFLVGADGVVSAAYEKRDLLPFAEYFPLPELDFLRRQFGRVREFTPGESQGPLPARAGRLGVLICNEGFYGRTAVARVREGAEVLISLANDGWVGAADYADIAGAMTAVRAVETDRWLVRASTSGPSLIVDPQGRRVAAAPAAASATLRGTVHPRDTMSPYVRWGDLFAWACVAITLVAVGVGGA